MPPKGQDSGRLSPQLSHEINNFLRSSQDRSSSGDLPFRPPSSSQDLVPDLVSVPPDPLALPRPQISNLRRSLHELGSADAFLAVQQCRGEYSTLQLCSAFHLQPTALEDYRDDKREYALRCALDFELRGRTRLFGVESVDDVVDLLRGSGNATGGKIIVLAGAGVSISIFSRFSPFASYPRERGKW